MEAFGAETFLPLLKNCVWFAILFVLSAFCSASETAITTTGRGRLLALQESHSFFRSFARWLSNDVQEALTVCLIAFLFFPFTWLLKYCVYLLGLLLRIDLKTQNAFVTREEIEQLVKIGEQSGALEAVERRMIDGIIDFEATRVHEVMVPRIDMVTLEASDSLAHAMEIFIEHGHSRLPVYQESPDDIVGVLYVKDTLKHLVGGDLDETVGTMMRKPVFVPETIRTVELLEAMRRDHVHIAVVVDEYGGVAGVVTMEDILEEIVGEIQDEYDQELPDILEMEDGTYLVQGNMNLEDLSDALEYPFESEDAESLGGLVLLLAGGFPQKDETFDYKDWRIRVVDLEDHRIKELRLERNSESE